MLKAIKRLLALQFASTLQNRGVRKAIEDGKADYMFEQDFATNQAVSRELAKTSLQMNAVLLRACEMMYQHGAKEITSFIDKRLPKSAKDLKSDYYQKAQAKGTDEARKQSARAFYNAKQKDGLNTSQRVWNLTQNSKKELEIIIQNGIKEGKTVDEISRSIRGYLNEPEKLFRRVKNKATGKMELSKSAQTYHPGQGVYRSSYKNAMRLVRTEMHRAYSEAKLETLRDNPHVKGYRVKLSNNHTTLINGTPTPFHCICDDLQGEYPKDFDFHGWHPQCRCVIIPILVTFEELREMRKGKVIEGVKDVPQSFKEFVDKNHDKIANPRLKNPLFLENNRKYLEAKKPSALEVAKQRHANRIPQQVQEIQKKWDERTERRFIKERRREIRDEVKTKVSKGLTLSNKQIEGDIIISSKGIKEWLNQPHKYLKEKNELLLSIDKVVKEAKYLGNGVSRSDKAVKIHILETMVKREKSWVIIKERPNREKLLYSISDSEKILLALKK